MFFTNMVKTPRIEKARMDGTEKTELFVKQLGHPWCLTVDTKESRLYWADKDLNRIEMSDIMGGNRRVLVDGGLNSPRGLALHGNHLYWLDRQNKLVER
jgi:low density lipoprotein receptor-related protein 5/6